MLHVLTVSGNFQGGNIASNYSCVIYNFVAVHVSLLIVVQAVAAAKCFITIDLQVCIFTNYICRRQLYANGCVTSLVG